MQYKVKTDAFEGPLDLLLHLINQLEIDIYDIPVAQITEQYMDYIHTMKELQLDVASEFLVMAATLLEIKSKMLLPNHNKDYDDELMIELEEDPREELVERLIEYRKYKEVADDLRTLEEERGLLFTKPPSDLAEYAVSIKSEQKPVANISLNDMLGALQKLLRRKKLQRPLFTKITRQEISLETRMQEIMSDLRGIRGRKHFYDLFPVRNREHIVVTFLALLELMKQNEITIQQDKNFADIYVGAMAGGE